MWGDRRGRDRHGADLGDRGKLTGAVSTPAPSTPATGPDYREPNHPIVHPDLPRYVEGTRCQGVLRIGDTEHHLSSGTTGPGRWLVENLPGGPGSGLTFAWKHVEGHAAALMRQHDINHAELFLNLQPCGPEGPAKCRVVLHKLIPPNATLDVRFPRDDGTTGLWRFHGGTKNWSELE